MQALNCAPCTPCPAGSDALYMVVDERGVFREDNFQKAVAVVQDADADGGSGKDKKVRGRLWNGRGGGRALTQRHRDGDGQQRLTGGPGPVGQLAGAECGGACVEPSVKPRRWADELLPDHECP